MYTLITASQIYDMTGAENVTETDVNRACMVIEAYTGLDLTDTTTLSTRDLACVRRAVAFQAAYAVEQPGLFSVADVTSVNQDGMSINMTDGVDYALAPLARRSLLSASWNRKVSYLRTPRGRRAPLSPYISDNHEWNPL